MALTWLKNKVQQVYSLSAPPLAAMPTFGASISLEMLIALQREAGSINLSPHSRVMTSHSGHYLSKFRGRGMDFAEVREYQPGDDIRQMDWRVTARRGKPHTKVFQAERERPVFLVVDQGPSMLFGTRVAFKSVIAAQAAALLAWAAIAQGDRVGGLLFAGDLHREFRPRSRKHGVLPLLKALSEGLPAEQESEGALEKVLARLQYVARPGSLIFVLSDFASFDAKAQAYLGSLARQCDVHALMIYDPLEAALPLKGRYGFSDGEDYLRIDTTDLALCQRYRQQFLAKNSLLTSRLQQYAIPLLQLSTVDKVASLLASEFQQ